MALSIIVASSTNRAIGKDNKLLWHLPADLKFFKEKTSGHTVIMGRKTFDSIGGVLPNRIFIVITSDASKKLEGCIMANSLEEAIALAPQDEEVFIIGGGSIYKQALALTSRIYLTSVHTVIDNADTFFPEINMEEWKETDRKDYTKDEKNPYDYSIITLERIV